MRFLETSGRARQHIESVSAKRREHPGVRAGALANAAWSASASNHCGFTVAPARTSCATTS